MSFTAKAVGLACFKFRARDLFKKKDLGLYEGAFWREVDESSMLMLLLSCEK